jgi:hypothetical protein
MRRDHEHALSSGAKVKNEWSYTFTHPHVVCGLHNVKLTLIAYFSYLSSLSLVGEHCVVTLVSLTRTTQH